MNLWLTFVVLATLFVAYSNGSNDNFKGVATLCGTGIGDYWNTLRWATFTTLLGSLCASYWAKELMITFSGKGFISNAAISSPNFLVAVLCGTAITVFLASWIGIPISTTHSLTGALIGSGLAGIGAHLRYHALWTSIFFPLLLSPILAGGLAVVIYPIFRLMQAKMGINQNTCLCLGMGEQPVLHARQGTLVLTQTTNLEAKVDQEVNCSAYYEGNFWGINIQKALTFSHYLSAGAVSFARGLNDTPKIAALCLTAKALNLSHGMWLVGVAIALGGLLNSKRVAHTMSFRITGMSQGQGFTANLITSFLVIFASRLGIPVSTTHVSCGSLFGIGLVNGKANWRIIKNILLAWFLTLPMASLISGLLFLVFSTFL